MADRRRSVVGWCCHNLLLSISLSNILSGSSYDPLLLLLAPHKSMDYLGRHSDDPKVSLEPMKPSKRLVCLRKGCWLDHQLAHVVPVAGGVVHHGVLGHTCERVVRWLRKVLMKVEVDPGQVDLRSQVLDLHHWRWWLQQQFPNSAENFWHNGWSTLPPSRIVSLDMFSIPGKFRTSWRGSPLPQPSWTAPPSACCVTRG